MTTNPSIDNPLLQPFGTPHETVPFDRITLAHYRPAFEAAMAEEKAEIEAIIRNTDAPTFENVILPLEQSGSLLARISNIFYNLLSAETSEQMEELSQTLSPLLTAHSNDISLNEALFDKVRTVYEAGIRADEAEQLLLTDTYHAFVRAGANLSQTNKQLLRSYKEELALHTLRFSQNLLQATNAFTLHLTAEQDIAGLPSMQREQAQMTAEQAGLTGYLFTLHAPSFVPFMTYIERADLREQMYMAYHTRATQSGQGGNYELAAEIVNLRQKIALLVGYPDYATYVMEHRMASTPDKVMQLLDDLRLRYTPIAIQEVATLTAFAHGLDPHIKTLQPWDWAYYAHKLKKQTFDLDPEALRPYFELRQVQRGVLGWATRLYGLTFKENKHIPVYHPDVIAYEVFDADGTYLAVLYVDFHPRSGKQGGAWMTNYTEQYCTTQGHDVRPHVSLVMNFSKPTKTQPALLSLEEVETFLHEFGHALHSICSQVRFVSQSGTNVYRDFVELPSQLMENFAVEEEFLQTFAQHYNTGEDLPANYIRQIKASRNFHVAYACLRQLSFGYLDMALYSLHTPITATSLPAFEQQAMANTTLLPRPAGTAMCVQFSHIMAGGYAAGYYSYKWSEVLDADAYDAFIQAGTDLSTVAHRFRSHILSRGGSARPQDLYRAFKDGDPTTEALLRRDGVC